MLQLTRDGDYAFRAVLYLAMQPEGKLSIVNDISKDQDIPKRYLSKIMQRLAKTGLVRSRRGSNGGFFLGRAANLITLRDTIEAVEGPIKLNACLIKKEECHCNAGCPVYPVWEEAQRKLADILDKSMAELAEDMKELQEKAANP